jgi:Ca-activated chloride channel family protein
VTALLEAVGLTVGWPLALYGLWALPLLALLMVRSRFPLGRRRHLMVLATRALSVAFIVLAVADLRLAWPTRELAVGIVVDGTASIAAEERATTQARLRDLLAAGDHDVIDATSPTTGTATATDLRVAVASLPRDRVRRLLLATDGQDQGADLGAAVAAARRSGVEVSILPVGDAPPADRVSVTGLEVPRLVRAGDTLDVGVDLHGTAESAVGLTLRIDGEVRAERETTAVVGPSTALLPVTFPEDEGIHEVTVELTGGGPIADNDRWATLLRITPRPRALILHDPRQGPPALARVLEDGGFRVDVRPLTEAPQAASGYQPYGFTVVDEASLQDASEGQQLALREWVEIEGGGLVTVTDDHPVRRTPRILREIEPIRVPPAIPDPHPLELVLVIDRSSSMSGQNIVMARRAAVAAVRALRRDARVGVVAFSGGADRTMAPVEMEMSEEVVRFIGGIHASGGTNIAAALGAANAVMGSDPRYIHHVILLSDGISAGPPALAAARALASRGVSISAISLGPQNDLMREIAQIGRGRYHVTASAGSLTSLFLREAQYRQPPAHRRGRFTPRLVELPSMLEGIDFAQAPALRGHALAGVRPGATTVLETRERYPILAHWHRGLGQVATWTSSTSGSWADEWRRWDGFREMWVALGEGMLRTRAVEPPRLHLAADPLADGVQRLTVLGPTLDGPVPEVVVHDGREGGEAPRLREIGPGVWQARISEGAGFLVEARMPGDEGPTVAVGHDRPYDPELARFGVNRGHLEELAAAGGGRVVADPAVVLQGVEPEVVLRPLRTFLLVAALLAYLIGVLLLRLPDTSLTVAITRPGSRNPRRSLPPAPPGRRRRWKEAA